MATVNMNDATQPVKETMGTLHNILNFFVKNWLLILVIIIAIILGIFAYFVYQRLKKERDERDSEAYAMYNTVLSDCSLNAEKKWIKKKYALKNLLWLGLPFAWNEHSAKLKDADNNLIGYYRGHYYGQDGSINYLVYKTALLGFMENTFIIKFPKKIYIKNSDNKKKDIEIDFSKMVYKDRYNDDIHIRCIGVQKISIYYYTPNFIYDTESRDIIDLRQYTHKSIMDDTWKLAYERMVNQSAKTVRKAVDGNPFVQARKQAGEIEQDTKEIEEEERYAK